MPAKPEKSPIDRHAAMICTQRAYKARRFKRVFNIIEKQWHVGGCVRDRLTLDTAGNRQGRTGLQVSITQSGRDFSEKNPARAECG